MPLLSDSKTCYVGTTPITKIYAGAQLVWGALQLRLGIASISGGTRIVAEFAENEDCDDCAALRSVYQWRYEQSPGVWTTWQPFTGWTVGTDDIDAYIFIMSAGPDNSRLNNMKFQLRTNGKIEQIIMDVDNAPNLGTITPTLTC